MPEQKDAKIERDSFVFYRSFYEAIKDLPRDIQGEIYTAIMEYSLNGNETDNLKPVAKSVFVLIKHNIDRQGKRGGFKGSETSIIRLIRNSVQMKIWKKNVYQRDNYSCQNCKKVGGKLNAHHIKPFSLYPDLRFEVSNGLTLCEKCHVELHKTEREWIKK